MKVRFAKPYRTMALRGGAAMELGLILPVLMMIILGCVDFGRFAYQLIAVANAARAGGAYAIMNNYTSASLANWQANVIAAATAEIANQDGYLSTDLQVIVPTPTTEPNGLRRVTVIVNYQFRTIINWNWPLLGVPQKSVLSRQVELRQLR